MFWFVLAHLVAFLVDLALCTRQRDRNKDLQILVLRHQLRPAQRQRPGPPRLTRGEKLTLAILAAALARLTTGPRTRLDQYLLLFKPGRSSRGTANWSGASGPIGGHNRVAAPPSPPRRRH